MLVNMPGRLSGTRHLILALPMESQGLFEAAGIPVSYCGIGKVNAASKAAELIQSDSGRQGPAGSIGSLN